jgi:hypothetical protein
VGFLAYSDRTVKPPRLRLRAIVLQKPRLVMNSAKIRLITGAASESRTSLVEPPAPMTPPGLAVFPHQITRVLVRDNRSDHSDAEDSQRR